jgi:hypothetical protein
MNRETWLNEMAARMAPKFAELGYQLPAFRVSISFPSGGLAARAAGECWSKYATEDEHFEIFINPIRDDSVLVSGTLAHELAHAAVGFRHGHKGEFAKCMAGLGFGRPFTSSEAGMTDASRAWLQSLVDEVGKLPHSKIIVPAKGEPPVKRGAAGRGEERPPQVEQPKGGDDESNDETPINNRPPKQTTRLLKATCAHDECGYNVRVTSKWLEIGPPHCPLHGAMETAQ